MSKVLISSNYMTSIADALRKKLNSEGTFKPRQMASAILEIQGEMTQGATSQDVYVYSAYNMLNFARMRENAAIAETYANDLLQIDGEE